MAIFDRISQFLNSLTPNQPPASPFEGDLEFFISTATDGYFYASELGGEDRRFRLIPWDGTPAWTCTYKGKKYTVEEISREEYLECVNKGRKPYDDDDDGDFEEDDNDDDYEWSNDDDDDDDEDDDEDGDDDTPRRYIKPGDKTKDLMDDDDWKEHFAQQKRLNKPKPMDKTKGIDD